MVQFLTGEGKYERCRYLLQSFPRSLSCYFIYRVIRTTGFTRCVVWPTQSVKLSSLHILVSTPVSFQQTRFNKLVAISDRSRCSNILNVRRNDETKISNVHFNHTYQLGRCTWGENNLMVVILTPDTIIIGFSQTWVTLQGQVLPHTHSAQSENV